MKLKIAVLFLFFCFKSNAQEGLSTVYPTYPYIIGKDTLYSYINGVVIDSLSHKPIPNVIVGFYSSRGDALEIKTDSLGNFYFNVLPYNCKIRIVCFSNLLYKRKDWYIDTQGMSELIQLKMIFELIEK